MCEFKELGVEGIPTGSKNPNHVSEQNSSCSTHVFRPGFLSFFLLTCFADFPIITCQSESPVCVVQGSVMRLYCDGVGRPAPCFQWYKNNVPIETGTCRELVKQRATNEDQGEYFCKVYNSAGEVSSELIQVNIAGMKCY